MLGLGLCSLRPGQTSFDVAVGRSHISKVNIGQLDEATVGIGHDLSLYEY